MDASTEHYALRIASAVRATLGSRLVGVYLHGSAVLGGFDAHRSDVDILVVCDGPITAAQRSVTAEVLSERRMPCPAQGLELSVVSLQSARHPTAEPAFELHMSTAPEDATVVDGHLHGGDSDLVLHFAVCRQAGRLLGPGLPVAEAFGAVTQERVRAQLATELHWSAEHAPDEYAVLNACRAWRFAVDSAIVSKIDGGYWALDRVRAPDHELISMVLDRQRSVTAAVLDRGAAQRFIRQALAYLTEMS